MLRVLSVRDYVIVERVEIEAGPGFTVLTGETGAGKSILIDALQLVLGGRGDAGVVREGCPRTEISAVFDQAAPLSLWLETAGFTPDDELLLRRVIDHQGKSRAWINGSPATVAQLKELGEQLVDIHGQHAWQSLTRPSAIRHLLDAYAGSSSLAREVHQAWQEWQAARKARSDADKLSRLSGATFLGDDTNAGPPVCKWAAEGDAGKIVPASTEQSNVDLGEELTRLIVAQLELPPRASAPASCSRASFSSSARRASNSLSAASVARLAMRCGIRKLRA